MPNRRDFLKATALAGAGTALLSSCGGGKTTLQPPAPPVTPLPTSQPFSQSPLLRKFIAPLPGLGTGIPVATPDTTTVPGTDFYNLAAVQFQQQMHPGLPPTTLWGYSDQVSGKKAYLGPMIVAQRGRPVTLQMKNSLPARHVLPIDTTLMGSESSAAQNRITVHLHGGLVPWTMDGGPFSWFTPDGTSGPSFLNGVTGSLGVARYYYPNNQSARLMWYHDHALGITRLNAYAGLAAGYLVVDDVVNALTSGNAPVVPPLNYTIPLIIQDKTFKGADDAYGKVGDLWYPSLYQANSPDSDTGRWDLGDPSDGFASLGKPKAPSCVPEFFADTPVINGTAYPYLQVEPRRYRFVLLNASQARFFNLNLFYEDRFHPTEADFGNPGPAFIQIGNEGGLLPAPVVLNAPPVLMPQAADGSADPAGPHNLLIAPAERADFIIDFSSCQPGDKLILYNDAPAPFPCGDLRNDYFTGNPDHSSEGGALSTKPLQGPNTRTLMQIQVVALQGSRDPMDFNSTLNALSSSAGLAKAYADSHIPFGEEDLDPEDPGVLFENKTLNEDFDGYGRLLQRLGTDQMFYQGSYARNYMDDPTEVYHNGQVVVWDIYNTTGDTHPMHFHLANVQVIGRAPFTNVGTPDTEFVPPDPNYRGWKETVRMNPQEVTRVIMKLSLPSVPFNVPGSPRAGLMGGHEYVWHCHILEHEEHDMMRPLVVLP